MQHKYSSWPAACCPQGERGEVGPAGSAGFAGPPVSQSPCNIICNILYSTKQKHTHTQLPRYWPNPITLAAYRALMVRLEQEESVDLPELREKLAPLALLDPLDSLDLLLVPFTLGIHTLALLLGKSNLIGIGGLYHDLIYQISDGL